MQQIVFSYGRCLWFAQLIWSLLWEVALQEERWKLSHQGVLSRDIGLRVFIVPRTGRQIQHLQIDPFLTLQVSSGLWSSWSHMLAWEEANHVLPFGMSCPTIELWADHVLLCVCVCVRVLDDVPCLTHDLSYKVALEWPWRFSAGMPISDLRIYLRCDVPMITYEPTSCMHQTWAAR